MFWRLPLYMYYIFSNIKNADDTRFALKMSSKLMVKMNFTPPVPVFGMI